MDRLRSALFLVYFFLVTLMVAVFALPAPIIGEKPARAAIRAWARMTLAGLAAICGVRFRVEGAERIPAGGAIVASNHQSMWETIALFVLLPKPTAVFKRELLRVPVYGWWGLRAGSIAIDRNAGVKAIRAMQRHAAEKVAAGGQVIVFPEGTRVAVGTRAPLQPGVAGVYAAAGAPVTPVAHDSGRFWLHPGWVKRPGTITLRVLAPIPPGLDRREFMARLESSLVGARPDLCAEQPPCAA